MGVAPKKLKTKQLGAVWHELTVDGEMASGGWVAVKKAYEKKFGNSINDLVSADSVYVIRLTKPWSIIYQNNPGIQPKHSPVIYIGRGNFKVRFTSHLKSRISEMSRHFEYAEWETRFCNFPDREDAAERSHALEAELIWLFKEKYGRLPLLNKRKEARSVNYTFLKSATDVLLTGQGKGFHYGIWPLPTSKFHAAALKA